MQQISKANFPETALPKTKRNIMQSCPMKLGQNFVKYFIGFWAMEFQQKMLLRFTNLWSGFLEAPLALRGGFRKHFASL